MTKVFDRTDDAVFDIGDGATIAVGGFGLCGVPMDLIRAVLHAGARDLRVVSNNAGVEDWGLGILLKERRITKMTSSYVGENPEFARQYLAGLLELELVPQGTLVERLRAGGCGIPAFYTPTGVGTLVSEGGLVSKYHSDGRVAQMSAPKETREFGGRRYLLEEAIVTDFALVRAKAGDPLGNLLFHGSARNFNPLCAMAGRTTIAEVEQLVEVGQLEPDHVHLPGIFVQRLVLASATEERPVVRRAAGATLEGELDPTNA
jgi:3-oxoacid CoA-transferase subunit A